MFYEDGDAVKTFITPGGHTGRVSVSNAECKQTVYKKTPQGTRLAVDLKPCFQRL